jgi:hypothetical protein
MQPLVQGNSEAKEKAFFLCRVGEYRQAALLALGARDTERKMEILSRE